MIRTINICFKIFLTLLIFYSYIVSGKDIYLSNLFQSIFEILGNFIWLISCYLTISVLGEFYSNDTKKRIFKLRVMFSFILLVFIINFQLLIYFNHFDKIPTEKTIFLFLYSKMKLGMFGSMFFYNMYINIPIKINFILTAIIIFFSLLIIFGKVIINTTKRVIKYCK